MRKIQYPANPKTFGERIRKLRMDKDFSVAELAKRIGISESYLWRIEENKQIPSVEKAALIAKILQESSIDYFLWASKKETSPVNTKKERENIAKRIDHLIKKVGTLINKDTQNEDVIKSLNELESMLNLVEKSLPKSNKK